MELRDYVATWSRIHGVRPRGLVSVWLQQMYRLAQPLARAGVSPNLVTLSGVVIAVGATVSSVYGQLVLAAVLVTLSGIADGLDGAVAVLQRRNGGAGAMLDAACDRVSDLLFVLALFFAGAPAWLCGVLAAVFLLHEYLRSQARGAGLHDDTLITVAERPTRVIVIAAFLLAAGTADGWTERWLDVADFWPTAGAVCALVLATIGMVQLTVWLRSAFR